MYRETYFEIDWIALGITIPILLISYTLYVFKHRFPSPLLFFSTLTDLKKAEKATSWFPYLSQLSHYLLYAAFALFMIAFIDPHFLISKTFTPQNSTPKEGIAIYLVIDQSGSMNETINTQSSTGEQLTESKEDLVKQVTSEFIMGNPQSGLTGRPNDLIGLMTFARTAQILSPLTLNHQYLINKLDKLQVVKNASEDGTSIGYALYKTVNLIAATRHYAQDLIGADQPAYDIKSSIIILVTDGLQQPHPADKGNHLRNMDLIEAAEYAKANGVRIYLVNVNPLTNSEELAPQREQMQQITRLTGGDLFIMNSSTNLKNIYEEIDQLEKSKIPSNIFPLNDLSKDKQPDKFDRFSLYPWLIAIGLFCLLGATFMDTLIFKRVP